MSLHNAKVFTLMPKNKLHEHFCEKIFYICICLIFYTQIFIYIYKLRKYLKIICEAGSRKTALIY